MRDMKLKSEITDGDFKFILTDKSIYVSKNIRIITKGQTVYDYISFLETTIICSSVDFIESENAFLISPYYRLVVNDMYIFLGKIDMEYWISYKKDTLSYLGKKELIRNISNFFNYSPLW